MLGTRIIASGMPQGLHIPNLLAFKAIIYILTCFPPPLSGFILLCDVLNILRCQLYSCF